MNKTLLQALEWRYAVKQFDSTRKISDADWKVLEQALVMSPSSYGLQPWKFLVVQDLSLREKLKAVSWSQSQVTDCSHYVVFLTKEKMDEAHVDEFIKRTSDVRGTPLEKLKAYRDMMIGDVVSGPRSAVALPWMQRQAYIAMGFLMEAAALLKIDTCALEGLDPVAYDEILNLKKDGYRTVACVALGYRSETDQYQNAKKVRFETSRVIEFR